jgi:hypothetical protein
MGVASPKPPLSSIGSDSSCAVPISRSCRSYQVEWSSSQPRSAKHVPYGSGVRPVATGAVSASTLTKRYCANSASANSLRWDEPSYVNGLLLNMHWHISDTGRDDVPAIEVSAKICLICAAALLFTICMSWLAPSSFNLLLDVDLELLGTGCLIVTSG